KSIMFFQTSSTNGGTSLGQSQKFYLHLRMKETCIPVMLKFFSTFSLAWVFLWQYKCAKPDHPKSFPILQRHDYVKWWPQFDSSMAYPEK
ncbi:hypothetical protein S245_016823, partial [Arachis hypogaea]